MIETKVLVPALGPAFAARPRLEVLGDRLLDVPLALVTGGGGFGKSTVLCAWAARVREHARVAWLSLEPQDASLTALVEGVAFALRRAAPELGASVERLLEDGGAGPDAFVASLANELYALTEDRGEEIALFLDDVQFIAGDGACLAFLSALLRTLPPRVHVVLASRRALTFSPVAKLRAAGRLLEVGEEALRFRADEAVLLVDDAQAAHALVERTEGWAMAVQLTASLGRDRKAGAGLKLPRQFKTGAEIDRPVIVKFYGAQGGKGYLFLKDAHDFEEKAALLARRNYILQEYIIGVPLYIHYFYSPLTGKLEIMSMDRRYETNVDSIGRIPAVAQSTMDVSPSYVVVGNSPVSLRESMLAEAYRMGEEVVRVSREICPPKGLFGAFCLETIITPEAEFFLMEISARIVAGTNLFIDGSPYSYLNYDEPMSTGRRIAREIKNALLSNSLEMVLDDSGLN